MATKYKEGEPLLTFNTSVLRHGDNSTWSSIVIIICAMAGVGVLGLPNGLAQSGWIGLVVMMVCVLCSMYTGTLIGYAIRDCEDEKKAVKDYADIGQHAFGAVGRIVAQFSVYTTLFGVSIIFLVLLGLLTSAIVPQISRGFWTLCAGLFIVLPLALVVKTMAEAKWTSMLGMAATVVVVVVAVISPIVFRVSDRYIMLGKEYDLETEVVHRTINPGVIGAFSIFTFAFGATALYPNVYLSMDRPHEWAWAVSMGYILVLCIVLPVTVVGYAVYGKFLLTANAQTILDAILFFDTKSGSIILKLCLGVMIIHILSALPLIMNPVFRFLELNVMSKDGQEPPTMARLAERAAVVAATVLIALFFPFFLDIMSLISCISVLPCLFYWKLYRPASMREKVQLVLVMVFGVVGSAIGIYVNGTQLVHDVRAAYKAGNNPLSGLFHFDF